MNSLQPLLIQLTYAPPVDQLALLATGHPVIIEAQEHYQKQSFRNRCNIVTSQGVLPLVIPIMHQNGLPVHIREARIEAARPWAVQHWRSLITGYNKSPYFSYYKHHLETLYQNPDASLFDFNIRLLGILCKLVKITVPEINTIWETHPENHLDLRATFHPKQAEILPAELYYQTFPVIPTQQHTLSCYDLIFNLGPDSSAYLKKRGVNLLEYLQAEPRI